MNLDRRSFLKGSVFAGASLAVAGALGGCGPQVSSGEADKAAANTAPDWLGVAPEISDDDCVETVETQILIVGAGMSGYFAACSAAEEGADVLLIDKGGKGVGVRCSAIGAVDSKMQKDRGVAIDKMEILNDFAHYAHNHNNSDLVRLWADNSGEAVDWYCDLIQKAGLFVELEWNMPPEETNYKMWPTGHGTVLQLNTPGYLGGAAEVEGLIQEAILAYYEQSGGKTMFNTTMQRLVQDDSGRVVGIYATNAEGDYIRINAAKGIVLATGGYAFNEEMMDAFQPDFKKGLAGLFAFPSSTGDGIKAAMWAGADLDRCPANVLFGRGAVPPDHAIGDPYNDGASSYFSFGEQPFLKVGRDGTRLCNESSPYLFVMNAAYAKNPADCCWFPIWDANWPTDVERFHTIACSTLIMRDGGCHDPDEYMSIEVLSETIDGLIDQGYIMKADTIEELAEKLQLSDVAAFLKTVERYNELYDAQHDADFGKEPFRLSAIRTAPFYGVKLGAMELATLHGIRTNTNFQALTESNDVIEGLYMIGNDQGGMFANIYPNFAAGVNAGRCATFGRMVGKALSK